MNETRITFPDVPGAAIVGDEEAVNDLLAKLTAGMDAAQLDRMLLNAEYHTEKRPATEQDAEIEQMENETPLTDEELSELWHYISGWTSWEVMNACAGNVSARQLLEQMRKVSSPHM